MKHHAAVLLLALCALAPLRAADAPGAKPAPPPSYCRFVDDQHGKGDFEVLVRRFRHPETGREVTLAGMIHLGDAAFYAKIDKLGDAHDVVLLEGVNGSPTFFDLPLIYTMYLGPRLMDPAALEHQGDHLRSTGKNRRNADVSFSDMSDKSGVSLAILALPVLVVAGETAYTLETAGEQFAWMSGNSESLARGIRGMLSESLTWDDPKLKNEEFDRVVLHERNRHLLGELDKELRKPSSRRILIPWGAAHHPELESALRARGFEPVKDEWITAIAVRSLGKTAESDPGFRWRLPYLLRLRFSDKTAAVDGPLSLVAYHDTPRKQGHSTLWGLLHKRQRTDTTEAFSLLAGLGWSSFADTEKGESSRSALLSLWSDTHTPAQDTTEFGWWGFLGGAKETRDAAGRVESSSWHLPLTFGSRPLLYRQETHATGKTSHRFLLFFETCSGR